MGTATVEFGFMLRECDECQHGFMYYASPAFMQEAVRRTNEGRKVTASAECPHCGTKNAIGRSSK